MMRFDMPAIFIIDGGRFGDLVNRPQRCRSTGCSPCGIRRRNCQPLRDDFSSQVNLDKWREARQNVPECKEKLAGDSEQCKPSKQESGDFFRENFDMHQFAPMEIVVTMEGNGTLMVAGRHELKSEDGHYVRHEYRRKVTLPENAIVEQIRCRLEDHGQLLVEVPLKKEEEKDEEKPAGRTIPIEFVKKSKAGEQQQRQDWSSIEWPLE